MRKCAICFCQVLFFSACWGLLLTTEENAARDNASFENYPEEMVLEKPPAQSGDLVQSSFEAKQDNLQVFAEVTGQNSGVANEITSGSPVVVTLTDVNAELKQRATPIIPSQNANSENVPVTTNNQSTNSGGGGGDFVKEAPPPAAPAEKARSEPNTPELQTENAEKLAPSSSSSTSTSSHSQEKLIESVVEVSAIKENMTEEIPSFSEWAQKRLEEAEKNKEPVNSSAQQQHVNGKQGSGAKFRWKNYASLDCGAKVVATNPEAISPSAILSPSRDEYKLNTCTSRIWFVVELCEAIQAKKIDFANFELFSSSPKDFTVSVSDRFPTREWSNVGQFAAKDERDIQSFDLHPHLFGKYIKVEVRSHYGSEHFCPISLFRVYGTSEFEVLQKEDPVHADRPDDEDDDDDENGETLDVIAVGDASKNLFTSATDAVISMVKKAAQALGTKGNHSNQTEVAKTGGNYSTPLVSSCTSPSHLVVCDNCSDTLFGQVYELLSCHNSLVGGLVDVPVIKRGLTRSNVCQNFGFEFTRLGNSSCSISGDFLKGFFPLRILGALCNTIAVIENKVVLNVSNQYTNDTNTKTPTSESEIVNIETSEPHVISKTEEIVVLSDDADYIVRSTHSTDVTYAGQIKPTKTLTPSDLPESVSHVLSSQKQQQHQQQQQQQQQVDDVKINDEDKNNPTIASSVVPASDPNENLPVMAPASAATTTTTSTHVPVVEVVSESGSNEQHPSVAAETVPEVVTESAENLDEHLELISELNGEQAQPAATSATPPQKESVFLRLSNRIKTLERNMSLSGQYLEELSKRYKKQVEEMQKVLDKTVSNLSEESRRNKHLEERLERLAAALEVLVQEKNSWSSTIYCVVLAGLVAVCILYFYRRSSQALRRAVDRERSGAAEPDGASRTRRKSIDVVRHSSPPKKKRRPSDQALKIVRSAMTGDKGVGKDRKKKKKKQQQQQMQVKRSNSIDALNQEEDKDAVQKPPSDQVVWNRQISAPPGLAAPVNDWVERKPIEEIPFVLEESEHSSLEPVLLSEEKIPAYVQTASNLRLARSSLNNGGNVAAAAAAAVPVVPSRKSASVDETKRRKSPVPPRPVNGSLSSSAGSSSVDDATPKKEKKGLKRIFKKVF